MLKHAFRLILCSSLLALVPALAAAQDAAQDPSAILNRTAANGKLVAAALREQTCYAELTIETISRANVVTGKYYHYSRIYYDADGLRRERVFEDKSTLPPDARIGSNAVNNLTRVYQFIITPESLSQYEFNFIGREQIDEINTFVFDVHPKIKMPDPGKSSERYLKGRVWIDDQDLQVVKVAGEALPEQSSHRTPRFETYFQNYGRFWFPAYASASDDIRVGDRLTRVVVKVKYSGYQTAKK